MHRLTFLLVCAIAPVQGFAAATCLNPPAGSTVGQNWPQLISELQAQGVQKVGDFDLAQFAKNAQTIQWKVLDSHSAPPGFATGRQTAFFQTTNQEVCVSASALVSASPDTASHLETHEALGALGYHDEHYQLSSALEMIKAAGSGQEGLSTVLGQTVFHGLQTVAMEGGGGGTSIGGGGDLIAIEAKRLVFAQILKDEKILSPDFIQNYPGIDFEPLYDSREQFVAVRFVARSSSFLTKPTQISPVQQIPGVQVDTRSGSQNFVSIYVPALNWRKSPALRRKAIKDAEALILKLFVVNDKTMTETFEFPQCKSPVALKFPKTQISQLRQVQIDRAEMLNGCFSSYADMGIDVGVPGIVPGNDMGEEIRYPNFVDYAGQVRDFSFMSGPIRKLEAYVCRLVITGGETKNLVIALIGGMGRMSTSINIADSDRREFTLGVQIFFREEDRAVGGVIVSGVRANETTHKIEFHHLVMEKIQPLALSFKVSGRSLAGSPLAVECRYQTNDDVK